MTTPTISSVTGTVATGNTLTIAGANLIDSDETNWDSAFTGTLGSFEGASFAADGWVAPGGYSQDTSIKLLGSKSAKITHSGSGTIVNGVLYNDDASQVSNLRYGRVYVYSNVSVGNGNYFDNYHKLVLNYPGSGSEEYLLNFDCDSGNGAYPGMNILVANGASGDYTGTFDDGDWKNQKWYCIEFYHSNSSLQCWVNNVNIINQSGSWSVGNALNWDFNLNYNMSDGGSGFEQDFYMDGVVLSSSRVFPASTYELSNTSDFSGTVIYQYPEALSNTSASIECDLGALSGPYYMRVTNGQNESSDIYDLSGGDGNIIIATGIFSGP